MRHSIITTSLVPWYLSIARRLLVGAKRREIKSLHKSYPETPTSHLHPRSCFGVILRTNTVEYLYLLKSAAFFCVNFDSV